MMESRPLQQRFITPSTRCICVIEGHPFGCFKRWCNPACAACVEFYAKDPDRLMLPELGTSPREDDVIPQAVLDRSAAAFKLLTRFVHDPPPSLFGTPNAQSADESVKQ